MKLTKISTCASGIVHTENMSSINLFQIMGWNGLSESSFFETRKQSMAWMKHGLQISLKRYALSMEDKLAAGVFGRATN